MEFLTFTIVSFSMLCWIVAIQGSTLEFQSETVFKDDQKQSFADFPFRNTSLPWDERVDDLVKRLTIDEVILQMARGGNSPWNGPAPSIPRLGIGEYVWNTECLDGVANTAENATAFPQPIGMAASFSPTLLKKVATAIGVEVRGKHNDWVNRGIFASLTGASCFAPVINIARDPRWGRIQETYGECPFLTGRLTTAFVTGLQGEHPRYVRATAACKHFDAYAGPEKGRGQFDAKVSKYDLWNTFRPAFKKCVEAGAYGVMCSYNSINGVPSCASEELLEWTLRDSWFFKGYVVSDDTAIEQVLTLFHYVKSRVDAAAVCANAGTNLELTVSMKHNIYMNLGEALKRGNVTEQLLRKRVWPLFYTRMRLGEFDPPEMNPYTFKFLNKSVIETQQHQQLATEMATKSFVLLKNVDGMLPLKAGDYKKVSVVGPMADDTYILFGGYSADTSSYYVTTPLDGIKKIYPDAKYKKVCGKSKAPCTDYDPQLVPPLVENADLVFVTLGTGKDVETEALDRPSCDLVPNQKQILLDVMKHTKPSTKIVLLLFNAGPLNVTFADESNRIQAIVEGFLPGQSAGEALYNILTNKGGNSSPAGRLPITWPKFASDIPAITNYSMSGRTYRYSVSTPLYPFGYGLSYTSFKYSDLIAPEVVNGTLDMPIKFNLTNTGKFDADEVIQCYLTWTKPQPVPTMQLAYFDRVQTKAGQTVQHDVIIPKDAWTIICTTGQGFFYKGKMNLYCGGQQPNQDKMAPSNVLHATFTLV